MLFRPLAFAATAAAFILVPEIPISDSDADKLFSTLPVEIETEALGLAESTHSRNLSVPCAACKGSNTELDLHFDVTDSALQLNGFEVFPNPDPRNGELLATLVADGRPVEQKALGYSLSVEQVAADDYQQMQLVKVELKILQVDEQFVEGVPIVDAQIVHLVTGDIFIGPVQLKESKGVHCTTIVCHARMLAEKLLKALGAAKGCVMGQKHRGHHHHHGADGHGAKPVQELADAIPSHGSHPDQPAPSHRHNWRLLLANIASHIFLPVLMGVTAGVGVAVFAMVLCSVVIRIHQFVKGKRTRRAGCCRKSKKRAARQQNSDVEKVSLIEALESEQPPQYQDDDDTPKN